MSTGLECSFFEPTPGKWFYALQRWDCPAGAWDWRDHANCFGPFPTIDKAHEHLCNNHANPGGFWEIDHTQFRSDTTYERLIANARTRF